MIGAMLVTFGLVTFTLLLAELNDIAQSEKLGAEKTLLQRLEVAIERGSNASHSPSDCALWFGGSC